MSLPRGCEGLKTVLKPCTWVVEPRLVDRLSTNTIHALIRESGPFCDMTVNTLTSAHFLPDKVIEVPPDVIRNFPHTKKVGTYLLGRTLGEGSFAKVKEGLHITTGEKVAVKVIDKKRAKCDSYVRKNLRREGKLLQLVRHPNVVQLLEIMETENSYYLVTELCQSGDLMDYICKRKKLEEKEVRRFIGQIVSAVDYLHRSGILHRDLKIENLLLDENRDIKIIDFGLSNSVRVINTIEGPRAQEYCVTQCGSPAYAAPELLSHKKYGPQVDIWSIGVNMYAMLTGNLPFTVEPFNIKTLHTKMMNGSMNPIPESLSRECKDLLKRFLTPDPNRRIVLSEAMRHPWLTEGRNRSLDRHPCPNKVKTDELDNAILKHMSDHMGFRMGEIIRFVTGNVPSSANATYQMLNRKHIRYKADLRVKGKIPATDSRLVEPTKISLVFQDIQSKKQATVPFNPKLLSKRQKDDNGCPLLSPRRQVAQTPRAEKEVTIVETDEEEQEAETVKQKHPVEASVSKGAHNVSQSVPSSPSTRFQPHPRTIDQRRQQNQTPRTPHFKMLKETQKYTPRTLNVARQQALAQAQVQAHAQTARTETEQRKIIQTPRICVPARTATNQNKKQVILSPRQPPVTINQNPASITNGRMFVHFGKRFVPAKNIPQATSLDIPAEDTDEPKPITNAPLISTPVSRALTAEFRPATSRTIQHDLKLRETVDMCKDYVKKDSTLDNRPTSPLKKPKINRRMLKRVRKDLTDKYSNNKAEVVAETLLLDAKHTDPGSANSTSAKSTGRKESCPVLHSVSPQTIRTQ